MTMSEIPSHETHLQDARQNEAQDPVRCAVMTVSDTRTPDTDEGGPLIVSLLEQAACEIVDRQIIPDDAASIGSQLDQWISNPDIHAILTTGGTGISRRDITVDVVRARLSVELPGFGELFRLLSYEQVKAAAMLSRAVAGLVIRPSAEGGETFIFTLPGSINAVETAMTDLIVPQLAHLIWERRK